MSTRRSSVDLINGPFYKSVIKFCIPILLANLLHTAYNLVDSIVVGRLIGTQALAAVTIGSDIMLVITLASNGLCSGAQILIGQYVGAGNREGVRKGIGTLLTLFEAAAIVITIALVCISRPLLGWLNTPAEAADAAWIYSITCYCGLIASFGYNVTGAILRGMGDSKGPLLFVGVASVVNLVLDVAFIALFNMGTFGAAFATVLSQLLSFLWALLYLYRRREQYGFDFKLKSFLPDKTVTRQFLKLGVPIMLQNTLVQLSTLYINSFIFAYGAVVTSVNGIGNRLGNLAMIVTNSLNRASGAFTAQNIAAGKIDRVKKMYLFNAECGFSFALILSAVSVAFREPIFRLFVEDAQVLELSKVYLPVLIMKYFAFAGRAANLGLINGIGKPKLNYLIGIMDSFVMRIGLSLLLGLGLGMGLRGFWYGVAIGGFSAVVVGVPYFLSGKWKYERLVTKNG